MPPTSTEELPSARRYLNRELSWLDFNERVLDLADDPNVPLLERAKFLAIFSQNLDEFFQVRVAGLKDQAIAGVAATDATASPPAEQLAAIRDVVDRLVRRQMQVFRDGVISGLAESGVVLSDWPTLDHDDREYLVDVFRRRIYPVLTPLAVDPGHPFPYISNLSLNLAVTVRDPTTSRRRFARVKVPSLLPRFVVMPDHQRFVPLEQLIAAHLDELFPGMEIEEQFPFRVTRNADLMLEDEEADDLLIAVEMELRRRRFGKAVRLEVQADMSRRIRGLLVQELEIDESDMYDIDGPLDLSGLWAVHAIDRPDLKDEAWVPTTQPQLASADDEPNDIFSVLRTDDVLVQHPYDSFTTSVEAFITQAANDPQVLAIKQTLYRTSGDSPIVNSLIRAAEAGKQVVVLIELKARFDEKANIAWARALEEAGAHVVYGLMGFKTHCKTAIVVREEPEGSRIYSHVGTGNYNPKTARLYEDVGLLSADPELGEDLTELFNFLTGYSRGGDYRRMLVAPTTLRTRMIGLIRQEASHPEGRIVLKLNSLVDREIIDELYAASRAGVSIDLIVRGICCLRPGVPNLSENIRVRSIVGRWLEHSRISYFAHEGDDGEYFLGSADMMPRNLDHRIEVAVPVVNSGLRDRIREILEVSTNDDMFAWELDSDGAWHRVETTKGVSAHAQLQEAALERARRRRDISTVRPGVQS